jgi:V/A-type H+-transporting ATPase subunit I
MAVARMLRVTALGHRSALEDIVERMQRAGAVQITSDDDLPRQESVTDDQRRFEIEERLGRADFVRDFLKRFREPTGRFSTFVSEKVHMTEGEFEALDYDDDFDMLYRECEQFAGRLADIERERIRLRELVHELEPWRELRLPIESWKCTRRVILFTGTIGIDLAAAVRQELREAVRELSVHEVGTAGRRQAWVVMVMPDYEEDVRSILARTDFEETSFPGLSDYPAEEIARAEALLEDYERDQEVALERVDELAESYPRAVALSETLMARRHALVVREEFGATERAFIVRGWVPESRQRSLETALSDVDDVDLEFLDAAPEDEPPVVLDNPRWLEPFEVITDLYGRPRYSELDPTPALFLWFFFFFGMCIGDFGYGVSLIAVAWLIKHRLDVAASVKRFMDLLMYGGAASAIVGALTGSYFALEPESLPGFMRSIIILDPLDDVAALLLISIVLGVFQVFWGVLLRSWSAYRAGEMRDAVVAVVSTLLLWFGVGASLSGMFDAPQALSTAGLVSLGLAVVLLGEMLFPPYGLSTALGVLKGLYNAYDTAIGHVSDFLSYTRLAALGLASVLVGQVMNIVAGLLAEMIPVAAIGLVAAAVVFVVGHAFNIAVSLLGAFVHTLRLQFVEFFKQFYEGGGTSFAPFDYGTKSLVLRREPARKEGG